MLRVIFKKSHFLRKTMENVSLIVPHFTCKANQDLKLGTETTLELVSRQ